MDSPRPFLRSEAKEEINAKTTDGKRGAPKLSLTTTTKPDVVARWHNIHSRTRIPDRENESNHQGESDQTHPLPIHSLPPQYQPLLQYQPPPQGNPPPVSLPLLPYAQAQAQAQAPHQPEQHPYYSVGISQPKPTVYLISYSQNRISNYEGLRSLLCDLLPRYVPHLYTIFASNFHRPPKDLWNLYSGVHPEIQGHVWQDDRARKAVEGAVKDLLGFVHGNRAARYGNGGGVEVALTVACGAGTHRSVAVAEAIAHELRREKGEELVIKVCHVHRLKMEKDPD